MEDLSNKIYSIYGKVSSLEANVKNIEDKLNTLIKIGQNPNRRCSSLRGIELAIVGIVILLMVSLALNPETRVLIDIVKVGF